MSRCEAVVKEVDADMALVELAGRPHACGNCERADGCGSGLLGLTSGPRRYWIKNVVSARPGDAVSLVVPAGMLLRTSLVAYLLPALLAIAGAATGQTFGGDAVALAGAAAGLAIGLLWLRRSELRARSDISLFSPQIQNPHTRTFKEVT